MSDYYWLEIFSNPVIKLLKSYYLHNKVLGNFGGRNIYLLVLYQNLKFLKNGNVERERWLD